MIPFAMEDSVALEMFKVIGIAIGAIAAMSWSTVKLVEAWKQKKNNGNGHGSATGLIKDVDKKILENQKELLSRIDLVQKDIVGPDGRKAWYVHQAIEGQLTSLIKAIEGLRGLLEQHDSRARGYVQELKDEIDDEKKKKAVALKRRKVKAHATVNFWFPECA